MSSPESPYHVLRRLISLIHNSPLETAHFYASLLHDLFAHDLLTGIALDVPSPGHDDIQTQQVHVDPHLAVHLKAWIHISAQEHYAAIHLVRDRVYHRLSTKKGKERATDDEAGSVAMPTLPFDGQRTHLEGSDACLECAMIMAEACQALNRFEEGRQVLHNVHQIVSRSTRPGGHSHVSLPSSLLILLTEKTTSASPSQSPQPSPPPLPSVSPSSRHSQTTSAWNACTSTIPRRHPNPTRSDSIKPR